MMVAVAVAVGRRRLAVFGDHRRNVGVQAHILPFCCCRWSSNLKNSKKSPDFSKFNLENAQFFLNTFNVTRYFVGSTAHWTLKYMTACH
jgi:hypothetical protein